MVCILLHHRLGKLHGHSDQETTAAAFFGLGSGVSENPRRRPQTNGAPGQPQPRSSDAPEVAQTPTTRSQPITGTYEKNFLNQEQGISNVCSELKLRIMDVCKRRGEGGAGR